MAGVRVEVSGRAEGLRGRGRGAAGEQEAQTGEGQAEGSGLNFGRCGDLWKVRNQVSDASGAVL